MAAHHHLPHLPPRHAPCRGILKNTGSQESRSPHLTWDEPNLALNDLNRNSTMKITEPKTPFVRYNAETDEVMNMDAIPEFDLGPSTRGSSTHEAENVNTVVYEEEDERLRSHAQSSSRRASSTSSRQNLDSTERRQVLLQMPVRPSSKSREDDQDSAEEEPLDPESKAKHDAFVRARKGHYGNEAEAMKRARELAERDESESEATLESVDLPNESASEMSVVNGTT